ncbi:MAG: hypothetical protein KAQ96_08930, partial [Thermoplasmata archaeon]|nr:hypothetical protein [Thermoplasmata archaeon]
MTIWNSTFEGLWATDHGSINTEGMSYGGILAIDAEYVELYDITITDSLSSGIYVQNSNVDANNLDISGFGSKYPAGGMIVALVGTKDGEASTITITNSKFHDGIGGSGILITSYSASGAGTVVVDKCNLYRNEYSGVLTSATGWTGNLTVNIINTDAWSNGLGGFDFMVGKAMNAPGSKIRYTVDGGEAKENGAYGLRIEAKTSQLNVVTTVRNLDTHDHPNAGIYLNHQSTRGIMKARFENVQSHENRGDGLSIYSAQPATMRDILGFTGSADGLLDIVIESCSFSSNGENGVIEIHNPSGQYQNLAQENFNLLAMNTTVAMNENHGWNITPPTMRPMYGDLYKLSVWRNCQFTDNKVDGVYIYHWYYGYKMYGVEIDEVFKFYNCTFNYNQRGFRQWFGQAAYGEEAYVTFAGCTFEDNDDEAIKSSGSWYSYYDSGWSYIMTAEYDIRNTLLDGYV